MITCRTALAAMVVCVAARAQTTVQLPLAYNFNGIAHAGETGNPDDPNGFRGISDRALDFTGGVPASAVLAQYDLVAVAGALDCVHLGNRDTVDNGNWAFDNFPDGDDVGVQPAWLPNPDQSGPQTTTLATPVPIGISSSATVLFHISNGGGTFDVTFGFQSGQVATATLTGPDWFGGNFAGRDRVDTADVGANLNLVEQTVDLSGFAGEQLQTVTFSNGSNPNAGVAVYAANVVAGQQPRSVNPVALNANWNGVVHSGEAGQPDAPGGFRSISDRALDFTGGVPALPPLDRFELVAQPGVLDCVVLGDRNAVNGGAFAFDPAPDGDDVGVQPSWLPNPDLTGPQTTVLAQPILLDGASAAEFLFQTSNGGGVFDVTFTLQAGSVTATLRGNDWFGGPFAGRAGTDRALPGQSLRVDEAIVDLSPLAGFVLTEITFSNFSNPNGALAVLAVNVSGCLACPNAGAVVQLGGGDGPTITTTSDGALGCPLEWTVSGMTPNTPFALWAVGLGASPLPLSAVFPACASTLHVPAPLTYSASVDAVGDSTFALSVVTDPAACGLTVTAQLFELVAAPCPFVASDALSLTIGN